MSWAIFFEKDGGTITAIHVAPVDGERRLDTGHALRADCACNPAPDVSHFGDPIYTHHRFPER